MGRRGELIDFEEAKKRLKAPEELSARGHGGPLGFLGIGAGDRYMVLWEYRTDTARCDIPGLWRSSSGGVDDSDPAIEYIGRFEALARAEFRSARRTAEHSAALLDFSCLGRLAPSLWFVPEEGPAVLLDSYDPVAWCSRYGDTVVFGLVEGASAQVSCADEGARARLGV